MSLRKIILNLLALFLGIVGIACGLLCLICLIALLFWQGLGVGTAVLALLCLSCLGLAVILSGQVAKRESKRLRGSGPRSLKTWWRSRRAGAGAAPALYPDYNRSAYHQKPGGTGGLPPLREAGNWPEDLRPYGERFEPHEDVSASQNRER